MRVRFLPFGLFAVGFALAGHARSDGDGGSTVRLVWESEPGTESCLSLVELQRLVEIELERSVFVAGDSPGARIIRVRLARDRETGSFRALVTNEPSLQKDARPEPPSPGVVRELSAAQCRELDEPLALVIALLADEEADPVTASPAADEASLAVVAPEPAADQEIQPLGPVTTAPQWEASQRDASFRYEADIAAAAGFGVLPNVGAGIELGFLAEPPRFPSLRLRVLGLVSEPAEPVPGATVSFSYGIAGLALCPKLARFARSSIRLCVGADLGVLHARSRGLEESRETNEFFGQAEIALRGALDFGRGWFGTLTLGATFPTQVDRFVYRQDGKTVELFQMAFVPFVASAGVAYEIL